MKFVQLEKNLKLHSRSFQNHIWLFINNALFNHLLA